MLLVNERFEAEMSMMRELRRIMVERGHAGSVHVQRGREGPVTVVCVEGRRPMRFHGGLVEYAPESRAKWSIWLNHLIGDDGSERQLAA